MHYVEHFKLNDVDTRQVACIALNGKPNAATEGAVGVLGIDITSPTHEVYKCVAVNGSLYTWELLSSGFSILRATVSGGESGEFPYDNLAIPSTYVVKIGDLIIDNDGCLYQVASLGSTYCVATFCISLKVDAYSKAEIDEMIASGSFIEEYDGTVVIS